MKDVVTAVLGGGQGSRLWPLTKFRAKPAVPIAGKFRLIDVAISNSLHAGIEKVFVLTQFNSASLHRHIAQTYRFDLFSPGFVNILSAEQSLENRDWYQGNADAVRQNLGRLEASGVRDVVILSGDQLYLMDLERFVRRHRESEADLTVAVKAVPRSQAKSLGVLRMDGTGRLVRFVEKPSDDDLIEELMLDEETLAATELEAQPGELLASMGIYIFRFEVLHQLLAESDKDDFGSQVIPGALDEHRVFGFLHRGYWRDIGTIPSFHQANLEMTLPVPPLDLYHPDYPIYTHPRFLPGSKVTQCDIRESILCDGSIISGSSVSRSIVGVRGVVRPDAVVEESIIMGATAFAATAGQSGEPAGVGRGCELRRTIVDFDASIGEGARLINESGVKEADEENYSIRDGIIVIPRKAVIPPGTVI
ncbi:MAG: sugar phosphate nucleotidyltransferase [Thermoanaerobaculia bacterium]|nr:sugar phosphate nucleotidyltransferase [Thermoanaerobaculia bacterium]